MNDYIHVDKNPKALNVNLVYDIDYYPWPFKSESNELRRADINDFSFNQSHPRCSNGGIPS